MSVRSRALRSKADIKIGGRHVRYWHKADIDLRGLNVCFGGKADITRT